jgi:hypothetical protein
VLSRTFSISRQGTPIGVRTNLSEAYPIASGMPHDELLLTVAFSPGNLVALVRFEFNETIYAEWAYGISYLFRGIIGTANS